MTRYPIGIQDFESLRKDGYAYVDKTETIYDLVSAGRNFFLSRPRRFGKSLFLSTIKSYFLGKRELFDGLAIEKLEKEWAEYPVLYMDFNSGKYTESGGLHKRLDATVRLWEREYDCASEAPVYMRFENVIRAAVQKTGRRVVILVDEYDKPMLQSIGNEELQREHREELKAFYSELKTMDGFIKFAFLTGVTKFGKVSVFSDLNNLYDLSMDSRYADICGFTEEEIISNFGEGIGELAKANSMSRQECLAKLKERYDGYHFETGTIGIYNPFSVLNTLESRQFKDYWFESGTPSFLVEVIKRTNFNLFRMTNSSVDTDILNCIDPLQQTPVPVIYQSGYLTIKTYNPEFKTYRLDFPNGEVREGFLKYLLPFFTTQEKGDGIDFISEFRDAVRDGRPDDFMQGLQDFFDSGDYRVAGDRELYFQNSLFVIFRLLGLYTEVEVATARGRIDLAVLTKDYVYVVELKRDAAPAEALRQIESRGYARKFAGEARKLYRIGVNFSTERRGIESWETVPQAGR